MKCYYQSTGLFIILIFLTINVKAQPTLTSAKNNININDVYTYHGYDASSVTPGSGGANVTWDFSGISSTATSIQTVKSSSASPNASLFPNANMYFEASGSELFVVVNSTEYSIAGINQVAAGIIDQYPNQREAIKFPITYNDVFNESFSGTEKITAASITYQRSGTITIKADGYGTLVMPYGTVGNVLRVATIVTYGDEFMGTPIATYYDTTYTWWHPEITGPILSFNAFDLAGNVIYSGTYADPSMVGVDEYSASIPYFSVSPNPATDQVNIRYELANRGNVRLAIRNMVGQEVMLISEGTGLAGQHSMPVDVSDLSEGMYMIEIRIGQSISTRKIVVR